MELRHIGVNDESSDQQAGMFVDGNGDGVLFADVSASRNPNSARAENEIVYTSLQGPEVAAYCRGTAELV